MPSRASRWFGQRAPLLLVVLGGTLLWGCGNEGDPPQAQTTPRPIVAPTPSVPTAPVAIEAPQRNAPAATPGDTDDLTATMIGGERLAPFVPARLGGVPRTQILEQAFAAAGAYQLPGGGYANLDIQNVMTILADRERDSLASCRTVMRLGEHRGCLSESPGRASLRLFLPERLVVILAADDDTMVRRMVADIDVGGLAAIAAQ